MGIFIKIMIIVFSPFAVVRAYRKAKKVQEEYVINMTIFSKIWLLFAVIFLVCYIFSGFIKTASAKTSMTIEMVFLALTIFLYILSILYSRWHINIDEEKIEYCSLSGKSRCQYFDKIRKAEIDEKDNLNLYSEEEKVLKIPLEIGQEYIIVVLKGYGVRVNYKYNVGDFVMKLPLFYPVLYVFFFVIAGLLNGLAVKVNMWIGILLWSVMMCCLACKAASDFLGRVVVHKNEIVQTRFLRRTKRIAFNQIVKVKRRDRDNAPHLYIYSDKGVEMKINLLCENRELLEELVKRHHWE